MAFRYFKRKWEESRGDDYGDWGASTWYFELDADGYATRQIEVYENGKILKYDEVNIEDEFGGLAEKSFDSVDLIEFEPYTITKHDFEIAWTEKI